MSTSDLPNSQLSASPAVPYSFPPPAAALPPAGLGFGQILERVFRLLRSHWRPFLGVAILPGIAMVLLYAAIFAVLITSGAFSQAASQPHNQQLSPAQAQALLLSFLPIVLIAIPVGLLVYALYEAAITFAVLEADQGRPVTASQCYAHAWSRAGRYIGLALLRWFYVSLPVLACWAVAGAGMLIFSLSSRGNIAPTALFLLIPLGILLYMGSIVYAVILGLRLSLAYPAALAENLTASQALQRSGQLSNGAKGRIFLLLLVIYAIGYACIMVVELVSVLVFAVGAIIAAVAHIQAQSISGIIGIALVGIFFAALMFLWVGLQYAAFNAVFAIVYRDQRQRKDGALAAAAPAGAIA
jgi:hypothetical protein